MFFSGHPLGYLAGKKKKKKKRWQKLLKRGFSKKRLKHYAIGIGVAAGAYFAAPLIGPALLKTGGALTGFFKKSGMSEVASQVAADQILRGERPIPPEVLAQMQAQEAGMLGGMGLPLLLVGGGVLAFTMFGGVKGGQRRGR